MAEAAAGEALVGIALGGDVSCTSGMVGVAGVRVIFPPTDAVSCAAAKVVVPVAGEDLSPPPSASPSPPKEP